MTLILYGEVPRLTGARKPRGFMTRFAGILSLAVAGAIAGCDSTQPVQPAAPVQAPVVFAPQAQLLPAGGYAPAGAFPASSVLSTGNLPLPPNNGLPFVDPLQDF